VYLPKRLKPLRLSSEPMLMIVAKMIVPRKVITGEHSFVGGRSAVAVRGRILQDGVCPLTVLLQPLRGHRDFRPLTRD
jgi:hypothetical protein